MPNPARPPPEASLKTALTAAAHPEETVREPKRGEIAVTTTGNNG